MGQRTSSTTGNDSIRQTACRRRPGDVTRRYSRRNADAFTAAKNKDCSGAAPSVQDDSRPIKSVCSLRCGTNNNNDDGRLTPSIPFLDLKFNSNTRTWGLTINKWNNYTPYLLIIRFHINYIYIYEIINIYFYTFFAREWYMWNVKRIKLFRVKISNGAHNLNRSIIKHGHV